VPLNLHLGRPPMTFNLIRFGLPNTAALLAMAIMPVVALTTLTDSRPAAAQVEQVESAAICQAPAPCAQIAIAAAEPEFVSE
jgi:hypothetical protein